MNIVDPSVRRQLEEAVLPLIGTLTREHGAEQVATVLREMALLSERLERKHGWAKARSRKRAA
jgi:hypothetical protein